MQKLIKIVRLLGLTLVLSICSTALNVKAQSPADDPGIGGVGSPTGGGLAGDGGPVVPFDGGMSLILAASGITYASRKIRGVQVNKAK